MAKDNKGKAFVREKTGSASLINLDGQWEHDFVDDPTPAGEIIRNSAKKKGKEKNAT
ncbi:MAG: hypothetical protein ACOX86_10970 [Pelotomaculaceae bacterium]